MMRTLPDQLSRQAERVISSGDYIKIVGKALALLAMNPALILLMPFWDCWHL